MHHLSGPHPGPPPICFNCSKEGHFVVDCPEPKRIIMGGPPLGAAPSSSPSSGNYSASPASYWTNGQNMGALSHFSKAPPVVTRFAIPSQSPHYGNSPAPYGPSPTAPPYQHHGSIPPVQSYRPPQGPYPPPQFQASAVPYSRNPTPQTYTAPSPNVQYGQGYHPTPQSQYLPNSTPQFNDSPTSYGPPLVQFQPPARQYTPRNVNFTGLPPPQWNNTTPVSAASPFSAPSQQPSSRQRQDSNSQREYSGTPSQQPQQTPQNDQGSVSDILQQTPQTPTPGFNVGDQPQISPVSPVNERNSPKCEIESVPSSHASTPYRRCRTISAALGEPNVAVSVTLSPDTPTADIVESKSSAGVEALKKATSSTRNDGKEGGEEGEYTEEDMLQEQFNWDFKKIFKEPTPTEHVGLSQPLSYTYTVTPVPLMDPGWAGSVSRYARKENLKEYLKPIRAQPQWDYLKEDPAFSDVKLEGPLIPLKHIREWMAQRHGIKESHEIVDQDMIEEEVTEEPTISRKRSRSHEQEDVDNQIQLEASVKQTVDQPNKRQKNEAVEGDTIVIDESGTPAPGTPTIGRSGTPTFGIPDDVWAPEPGEAASTPMDPTEALLASLGVSGAPKPVREESNPLATEDQFETPSFGNIPHSLSPQAHASSNGTPQKASVQNIPHISQGSPEGPPQNHSGYSNPQYNNVQQSNQPNGNIYGGPPPSNTPYPNHGIPAFNNSVPQPNTTYEPQYGAPYNPPLPQRQHSFGSIPYGPPQGQYPSQGPYPPPQHQYQPQLAYNGQSNTQYGPPQAQWSTAQHDQYNGPPQYGPGQGQYGPLHGQYGGLPQVPYAPPHGQYGGPPQGQWGAPQSQYGPPQGQYNNGYHHNQGPPQYGNPGYPPQPLQYANIPQQGNPQHQLFNAHGPQPPRQDSGYASARGSYSNGSGFNVPNSFSNAGPIQQPQQANGNSRNVQPPTEGMNQVPAATSTLKKEFVKAETNVELDDNRPSEPESPLSPTSAEILGKLTQPSKPRKIIRVISGKNKNQVEDATKKSKRPAPVVAEAYSRRW